MIWNEIANNPTFKIENEQHYRSISSQLINSQEQLDPSIVDLVVSRIAHDSLLQLNPLADLFHFLEKKAILLHSPAPHLIKLCEDRARFYDEFDMLTYLRRLGHESELAAFLLAVRFGNEENHLNLIDKIDHTLIPNAVFSKIGKFAVEKLLAAKTPPLSFLLPNQKLSDEFTADLVKKGDFVIGDIYFDIALYCKKLKTFEALKKKKPILDPFMGASSGNISSNSSVIRHYGYQFPTLNYGLPPLKKTAPVWAVLLRDNGFVDLEKTTHFGGKEIELYQGTEHFRSHFYQLSRRNIQALSPKSLRETAAVNTNNYLILTMKRAAHVWGFTFIMETSSGKKVPSEGFHESFTIPFWIDALNNLLLNTSAHQPAFEYVITQLKNVYILEHMSEKDKIKLMERLDGPETTEPLIFCSGHIWHLTIFVIIGKKAFHCNRGTTQVNGIQSFTRKISPTDKSHILSLLNRMGTLKDDHYDESKLIKSFGLTLEKINQMSTQKTGTCTHTSVDALIFQLLNIYYQDDAKGREAYKLSTAFYRTYVLHNLFKDRFELNSKLYYDLFYGIAFKLQKNKLDAFTPTAPYRDKVYAALNKLSQK